MRLILLLLLLLLAHAAARRDRGFMCGRRRKESARVPFVRLWALWHRYSKPAQTARADWFWSAWRCPTDHASAASTTAASRDCSRRCEARGPRKRTDVADAVHRHHQKLVVIIRSARSSGRRASTGSRRPAARTRRAPTARAARTHPPTARPPRARAGRIWRG